MKTLHVLNLGAGVQSTALYLMSLRQDEPEHVPRFDYAVFADTQEEPKAVYEHLAWLKSLGGPPILEATAGKLGDDLINGFRRSRPGKTEVGFKQIPAFQSTTPGVMEGKAQRHCTAHYKVDVVERTIRRQILGIKPGCHMPKEVRVVQSMGLSFDEPGRIVRVRARFQKVGWSEPRFTLFDLEMSRQGCLRYLEDAAPGRHIPRSACVFCPYHSNAEWRRIRDTDPEGWERACAVDDALRAEGSVAGRGLDAKLYVHRSCRPLREAPIDTPESRGEQYTFGFASECEGMCGN